MQNCGISLDISYNTYLVGCSNKTVLLRTHNICFGCEIRKKRFLITHAYLGAWKDQKGLILMHDSHKLWFDQTMGWKLPIVLQ